MTEDLEDTYSLRTAIYHLKSDIKNSSLKEIAETLEKRRIKSAWENMTEDEREKIARRCYANAIDPNKHVPRLGRPEAYDY